MKAAKLMRAVRVLGGEGATLRCDRLRHVGVWRAVLRDRRGWTVKAFTSRDPMAPLRALIGAANDKEKNA